MNRSGEALTTLWQLKGFDTGDDLLVVTDDANLDVARVRFRPSGGSGGHNGLKSVTGVLGTDAYARLRVGVGVPDPGVDMADWVLSAMPPEDEAEVVDLLPTLSRAILVWGVDGTEVAMNQFNK
jgi:PTH1 family peptidyl-tRNA hydrolase